MSANDQPARRAGWVWKLAPFVAFAAMGALFATMLLSKDGDALRSALIDQAAPEFDIPSLRAALNPEAQTQPDLARFDTADLATGDVIILNFWASWCGPCRIEHPALMELSERGVVDVFGVAYRDKPEDSQKFLDELGDPFEEVGSDAEGRVGLSFGLAGVPETFVINGAGEIVYKHVGPIQNDDLAEKILPAIQAARRATPQS